MKNPGLGVFLLAAATAMAAQSPPPEGSGSALGMVVSGDREGPRDLPAIPWQDAPLPVPQPPWQAALPSVFDGPSHAVDHPINRQLLPGSAVAPAAPPAATEKKAPPKRVRGQRESPVAPIMQHKIP